jgi:xanthine/uracil permease
MTLNIGDLPFGDIGLAGIVGVVLNLILPMPKPNQPTQPKVVEAPSI